LAFAKADSPPLSTVRQAESTMRKMTRGVLLGAAAAALAVSFGCATEPFESVPDARFVGSETCGACHQEQ